MNNDKKTILLLSTVLVVTLAGSIGIITEISLNNKNKVSKKDVDIQLEVEADKISKSRNIYSQYQDKAPVSEQIVEDNAMKDMEGDDNKKEEKTEENKVVTEIIKSEFNFRVPLEKNKYEIEDLFSDEYEGLTQTYIETIIFKVNFKSGNPGIIFKVKEDNTPVYAMEDGVVESISDNTSKNAGYSIIISHANGMKTEYYCLKQGKVTKGQKVKKSQIIALAGDIGSTLLKNELRIYMLQGDRIINPLEYIK